MNENYNTFLDGKVHVGTNAGFEPLSLPDFLFGFQSRMADWAIRKGRGAILADCGLGKTPMELVWADNVCRKTGSNVIILTCLAVAQQIVAESEKFGIPARQSVDGTAYPGITVTNYEKLHLFNPKDFAGVVCDESSILKNFDGRRKTEITQFIRTRPYRLLASATPAPNDFTELGTSSEALGYMGHVDMLNKFFKNTMNNSARGRIQGEVIKWRFKGHAEDAFWRWVSSWALAARRPSDLGYENGGFNLPKLTHEEHIVEHSIRHEDSLFTLPAVGLLEQRQERRETLVERCEASAEIINRKTEPSISWCHMNDEGDLLEKLIPDAVQISGKDSDSAKERKFLDFSEGKTRVLITKPKIGAWGLNFQHCGHMTFFPSHSFEQYYQAVRRCWRFGRTEPVHVDIITTDGERGVLKNMQNKERQSAQMFESLVRHMSSAKDIPKTTTFTNDQEVPKWL